VSPPRALIVATALLAGCAAKHQVPPLAVPELALTEGAPIAPAE
jgi:hypothetical protein